MIGPVGHALEHHHGRAVGQRAVDDIAVPGDPADIGGAPVDVAGAVIEHVVVRHRRPDEIAARGVQHALGLAGRARGIEDEQRILRAHFLRRAVRGGGFALLVPPVIAARCHRHVAAGVRHGQHRFDPRALLQRRIDIGLERHQLAAAHAAVGGDHQPAVAVLDAPRQRLGREAAEHHRMDRADPRAGEHGDRCLRDHRHVDGDPLAAGATQRLQRIGHAADFLMQLAVGELALLLRIVAFPDDRDHIAVLVEMPVEAVGRYVERTVGKPFDAEVRFIVRAFGKLAPRPDPVDPRAFLAPEGLGLFDRAAVFFGVALGIDIGPGGPFGGDGVVGGHLR